MNESSVAPHSCYHLVLLVFQILSMLVFVFAYFLIFVLLNCRSSLYILVINISSDILYINIFSQSVGFYSLDSVILYK